MPDLFIDIDESTNERIDQLYAGEFQINRPVYNEVQFSKKFAKPTKEKKICSCFSGFSCSPRRFWTIVCSLLPVLTWLPKYSLKKDLVRDLAGGLTVGIMQIPQGMAYSMLTSLPPIYGLYVSFVPVLVYFLFGTSRHISLGTFAIVCLMSGEVIENAVGQFDPVKNSGQNMTATAIKEATEAYRVEVAVTLSCFVGLVQIFLGIIRLGFVTIYLSDPLISGFTTGAAFHILSSQVRHFLGLTVPSGTNSGVFALFKLYVYFFKNISDVNISALVIGIICVIILFVLKFLNQKYKFKFPIPAELIVVILGAGISYGANFNEKFGTPILKNVPKGLPKLTMPSPSLMGKIISGAFTIAIVAFAVNVSLVKSFAKKNDYQTDSNQELLAYGLANTISCFFSCFPSAASLSRSLIQESLGNTQVTGLISVVLVLLVLLSMASLFKPLPNAVLAAIVLVALKGLFKQFAVLKCLWKISKIDALIWFTSFLAVFCLGVDYGLAVGIVITLLSVVARTSRPSFTVLGQLPSTNLYKSIEHYNVTEVPGVKILQYNASLYYANVEYFLNVLSMAITKQDCPKGENRVKQFSANGLENSGVFLDDNQDVKLESITKANGNVINNEGPASSCSVKFRRANSKPTPINGKLQMIDDVTIWQSDKKDKIENIILDCSQCSFIDSMGVSALGNVVTEYKKSDIEVYLANCSDNVLKMLDSGGFITIHGKNRIFLTVHDAVIHCTTSETMRKKLHLLSSTSSDEPSSNLNDEEQGAPSPKLERSPTSTSNASI